MTFDNIRWFTKSSSGVGFYASTQPVLTQDLISIKELINENTRRKSKLGDIESIGSEGFLLICKEGAFLFEDDTEDYIPVKLESIYKDAYNNIIGQHDLVFASDQYENNNTVSDAYGRYYGLLSLLKSFLIERGQEAIKGFESFAFNRTNREKFVEDITKMLSEAKDEIKDYIHCPEELRECIKESVEKCVKQK
ncbi:hypothetical protein AB0R72_08305 [Bacillus velezensis]|uniref:hypothetical protein n=1 Tax=Bacillus velezensis TaxID=492670 RepID=UPI00345716D4